MSDKMRILFVDDDVIMGMEVKEILEEAGYEVCDIVSSGSEAVQSARSHKPDVVLMDIRIKGDMDGLSVARKIRSFSEAPIIFISGYKDIGTKEKAVVMRNTLFLSKPLDPAKLLAAIKSFYNK